MLEKIKLWWRFEGRYYYKDFIQGVKNLYKWLIEISMNKPQTLSLHQMNICLK